MASGGEPVLMKASLNSGDSVTSFDVFTSNSKSLALASAQLECTAQERDDESSGIRLLNTLFTPGALSVSLAKIFSSLNTVKTLNLSFSDSTPVIGNAPTSASPLRSAV